MATASSPPVSGIDLYSLPLGAGGHSVRLNGLAFDAIASHLQDRPGCSANGGGDGAGQERAETSSCDAQLHLPDTESGRRLARR
jgi:hypothetical protein